MWYRWATVAIIGTLITVQSGWAQPGGGGGGRNQGGGRGQDDAIRRLEREVAQLKSEIQKLQTAQARQQDRRGGPPAFDQGRGGPGGGRGQMAFRGQQFGRQGWNQPPRRYGFRQQQFQSRGYQSRRPGDFRDFNRRGPGPGGPPPRGQGWQQSRGGFPGSPQAMRGGNPPPGGPGNQRVGPPPGRPGDDRPNPNRRPPRPSND